MLCVITRRSPFSISPYARFAGNLGRKRSNGANRDMSLQSGYDKLFLANVGCHGAWPPIANPICIGAYGTIDNGVFNYVGTVQSLLGISSPQMNPDVAAKEIDFSTGDFSTTNWVVEGQGEAPIEVDEFVGYGTASGYISYGFSSAGCIVVVAPDATLSQVAQPLEFASTIWNAVMANSINWDHNWQVVYAVYNSSNYVVIANDSKNTSIDLGGKASILSDFGAGTISGQLSLSGQSEKDYAETGYNEPSLIGYQVLQFSEHHKDLVRIPSPNGEQQKMPNLNS